MGKFFLKSVAVFYKYNIAKTQLSTLTALKASSSLVWDSFFELKAI